MAEMKAARAAANGEDVEGTSSDSDAPNGTPYYSMLQRKSAAAHRYGVATLGLAVSRRRGFVAESPAGDDLTAYATLQTQRCKRNAANATLAVLVV
jgi:hypothetical protein